MIRNHTDLHSDGYSGGRHPQDAALPDEPLDLRAALQIVEDAERSVHRQLSGNAAMVYLLWGLTWVVGYGALEGSRRGWLPLEPGAALVVLGVALAAATVSTVAMTIRGTRGLRGHTAFQGGMYGASWALGFLIMGILSGIIGRTVEDFWMRGMLINSIAVLIAGLLYITGGTTFNDRRQSFLGVWLLVVTIAALLSGPAYFLTVFLYLGSGGLLAGSLAEYLGTRKRKTAVSHA
ncbi:hypothetical protein QNO08_15315 [Arthrobacter sp. zg-Y820]|uniref:hypothetical protein n=1 Tax=unclassified Arthrobacter TaxID=235627 RepID=UPI001E3CC9F6|nr:MULTISPECIES: hypothetical protein [unclassified Arthrobacter]MCC9197009.1 hypothetical protein [Arthrobacter sp. zg-Y820]MDK1279874.1 hypothetical protein [Arthrobacter sp. zg.Y820]WIB09179.1 hypothetical protein QNO08_15315 [Arthrobacter sp. zg-Y820]